MWRLWCALAVLAVSVGTAAIMCWNGHWAGGLASLVAGTALAAQVAFGFIQSWDSAGIRSAYAVAGALGIAAIFLEHRAFEPGRSEVQAAGLAAFAQLDVAQCPGRPANFNEFQISGLNACALQGTLDQMDAIQQLQKAEKLPGELALGDSVYQLSQESSADRCVELMRILIKACPYALSNDAKGKLLALQRH